MYATDVNSVFALLSLLALGTLVAVLNAVSAAGEGVALEPPLAASSNVLIADPRNTPGFVRILAKYRFALLPADVSVE